MIKISDSILNLKPYVPGKSIEEVQREYGLTDVIKLASNENPLGPSPKVMAAITKSVPEIHRYPDGSYYSLKNALAPYFGVAQNRLSCGNGSNELIDLIIRIFCEPGSSILISQASFVAYKVCAHASRVSVTEVPMKRDFSVDIDTLLKAWTPQHKAIFLPNPNNPTGLYINSANILKVLDFAKNKDVLVVIDEAYVEFIRAKDYPQTLELQKKYPNLIVLRTMAKAYGLAGLRLGVMFAEPEIIGIVERVRNPFNVNLLVVEAAKAAIQDKDYISRSQKVVWDGLDYFYEAFSQMGLFYCPSQGNFVFFDTGRDSELIFEQMLRQGVILRPLKNYGFPTQIRISVGLPNENEKAIKCLKAIL